MALSEQLSGKRPTQEMKPRGEDWCATPRVGAK